MGHNPTEEERAFAGFMNRAQGNAPQLGGSGGGGPADKGEIACCLSLLAVLIGIGYAIYYFFFK